MGFLFYAIIAVVVLLIVKKSGLIDGLCNACYVAIITNFVTGYNLALHSTKKALFDDLHQMTNKQKSPLRILEIGAGSGANFTFYPDDCQLVCLEPKEEFGPHLKENAKQYLKKPELMEVIHQPASYLKHYKDDTFDAVVMTLLMCSIDDLQTLLSDAKRVLKPGGKLYFLEHVAGEGLLSYYQSILGYIWPHFCDGCMLNKRTWLPIQRAGFSCVDFRNFMAPLAVYWLHLKPHMVGTATK